MTPTYHSRRGFLLAGAAAGLSLPVADGQTEVAPADVSAAKSPISNKLFPGFAAETVKTNGTTVHVLRKGSGRPLLLLHGYPETI